MTSAAQLVGDDLYIKDEITVEINGQEASFNDPILNKNNQTLLPMRAFFEAIDASISWNQDEGIAAASKSGQTVEFELNSNIAYVNDRAFTIQTAPILHQNRTYVPLRAAAEHLGETVTFDQANQTIDITFADSNTGEGEEPGQEDGAEPPIQEVNDEPAQEDTEETQPQAPAAGNNIYIKDGITIVIDGQEASFSDPIINQNGHTLLPMRALANSVGASVGWNQSEGIASLTTNGQTAEFQLNSNTAYLNEQAFTIPTTPILYQNRTYIPLRAAAEHLGETVRFDFESQTIEITSSGADQGDNGGTETGAEPQPDTPPAEPEDGPYTLHMNNETYTMDHPVFVTQGRTYIPASYFHDFVEGASGGWQSENTYEMQVFGLSFVFQPNSNTVMVNERPIQMDETPFRHADEMYIPVTFMVNVLDGTVRHLSDSNDLFIYLNDVLFSSDFLDIQEGVLPVPQNAPQAELSGDRSLLVSDNPEIITNGHLLGPTATLSQHEVTTDEQSEKHRVYGWHVNQIGEPIDVAITVENVSDSTNLEVTDSRGASERTKNNWYTYVAGLPIADKALGGGMQTVESAGEVIEPGETAEIRSFELPQDYLISFLHDMEITSQGGGTGEYVIRTVLAKDNRDVTEIDRSPLLINRIAAHPRGAWPSSSIGTTLPEYTIGEAQSGYSISNGATDDLLTAENSLSQQNGSVGNHGHFGMNYQVDIPVYNPTGEPQTINIKFNGRGGQYSGAVKVNGGEVMLIPTLSPKDEYAEIPYTVTEENETISLEIMHAGGAALPVAIYLDTE